MNFCPHCKYPVTSEPEIRRAMIEWCKGRIAALQVVVAELEKEVAQQEASADTAPAEEPKP